MTLKHPNLPLSGERLEIWDSIVTPPKGNLRKLPICKALNRVPVIRDPNDYRLYLPTRMAPPYYYVRSAANISLIEPLIIWKVYRRGALELAKPVTVRELLENMPEPPKRYVTVCPDKLYWCEAVPPEITVSRVLPIWSLRYIVLFK